MKNLFGMMIKKKKTKKKKDNTPPEGGEPDANEIDDGDEDGREKLPARGRGIPDE